LGHITGIESSRQPHLCNSNGSSENGSATNRDAVIKRASSPCKEKQNTIELYTMSASQVEMRPRTPMHSMPEERPDGIMYIPGAGPKEKGSDEYAETA
jgi:hypothetical protein